MKKMILLSLFAQFGWATMQGTINTKKNTIQLKTQSMNVLNESTTFQHAPSNQSLITYTAKKLNAPVGEVIGTTTYDLQTNSGVCRRVATNPPGTFTYVGWTMGMDFPDDPRQNDGWPGRGTGFNFYNRNTGKWQSAPNQKIEPMSRSGWPNIGFSQGRQFSITHSGGMLFTYRTGNQSDWQEIRVGDMVNDQSGVWARAAIDPPNIYVVIGRDPRTESLNGINGGLNFIRSTDNGNTWESTGGLEANYAETFPRSISGDTYQIDASNDIVSVILGNVLSEIVLYKSINKGDTWEKKIIQKTSNPLVEDINQDQDNPNFAVDPFFASGGGKTIIIDSKGKSHIVFSGQIQLNQADNDFVTDGFYSLIRETSALFYWNEDMTEPQIIGKSILNDNNEDGELGSAIGRMFLAGAQVSQFGFPFYADIVAHPQLAIDNEDNLYVSYSAAVDGHFVPEKIEFESSNDRGETIETFTQEFPADSIPYYDVFMLRSADGGLNWQGPLNVTNAPASEETYPSIPRFINDTIFLAYQHDVLPGTFLQNPQTMPIVNEIAVVKILPEDINDEAAPKDSEPYLSILSNAYILPQNCSLDKDIYLRNNAWGMDYPDGLIQDIQIVGEADYSTIGTYTEVIYVEDSAGNQSDTIHVSVEVIPDDLAPEIEIDSACTEFAIVVGSEWENPAVTITDFVTIEGEKTDSGCDLLENLQIEENVNTEEVGTYTVKYTVTDFADNEATLELTVEVIAEDADGPIVEVTGLPDVIGLFDSFSATDVSVTARDNVDCENVEINIEGLDEINTETLGDYPVAITVTDQSGNATPIDRVVTVGDNTAPTIILNGAYTIAVGPDDCGDDAIFDMNDDPWVYALDETDGDLTDQVNADYGGGIDCNADGVHIITYTVTDASGNEATAQRSIRVELVGIEDNPLFEFIDIYPNPTKGLLQVETIGLKVEEISVYTIIGERILNINERAVKDINEINLNDQAEGIYVVRVITANGTISQKVIINKN